MAKRKLTGLLASLEEQDGKAREVDVKEESATLPEPKLKTSEDDGSDKNEIETAHQNVSAGMKDYTTVDDASKRKAEVIHKQLQRLEEASGALEAYLGILRGSIQSGQGIGRSTASVIVQDLNAQYPKFFKSMVSSLESISLEEEAIGYSSSSKDLVQTKEAEKVGSSRLEKLKKVAGEVWEKFMEMIKAAIAKAKEFGLKIKEFVTGTKAKSKDMAGVIKALPAPGQPFKNAGSISTTSGLSSAAALKAISSDPKAVAPEPPAKVKIDALNSIWVDGKIDLESTASTIAGIDYVVSYFGQWDKAVDKVIALLDERLKNPPADVFNNDRDISEIEEALSTTVGTTKPPTEQIGGMRFDVHEKPAGTRWSFVNVEQEIPESVDVDLPSKQEMAKCNAAIEVISNKCVELAAATEKGNHALERYAEYMTKHKDDFKFALSNFILVPASLRSNVWAVYGEIQRMSLQRLWALDAFSKAYIKGMNAGTKAKIDAMNDDD